MKTDLCNCPAAPIPHGHHLSLDFPTSPTPDAEQQYQHLVEHIYAQPGDCTPTSDLRHMLNDALNLYSVANQKLLLIERLRVHGGESVDAVKLYAILGKPIPEPTS